MKFVVDRYCRVLRISWTTESVDLLEEGRGSVDRRWTVSLSE